MRYTCSGSVRGKCGIKHRTIEAAQRCLERDQNACHRLGGGAYSDREIEVVLDSGRTRPLESWERRYAAEAYA